MTSEEEKRIAEGFKNFEKLLKERMFKEDMASRSSDMLTLYNARSILVLNGLLIKKKIITQKELDDGCDDHDEMVDNIHKFSKQLDKGV